MHLMLKSLVLDFPLQTMYQNKKFSTTSLMPQRSASQAPEPRGSSAAGASTNSAGSPGGGSGGAGSAAKQRLRWTPELHDRFVDAVTQLGGPERKLSSCLAITWLDLECRWGAATRCHGNFGFMLECSSLQLTSDRIPVKSGPEVPPSSFLGCQPSNMRLLLNLSHELPSRCDKLSPNLNSLLKLSPSQCAKS